MTAPYSRTKEHHKDVIDVRSVCNTPSHCLTEFGERCLRWQLKTLPLRRPNERDR
jgi:hypothetical protein